LKTVRGGRFIEVAQRGDETKLRADHADSLAYYVGQAVAADSTGFFHIISRDAGYDPLIEHLRSKHIRARRHDDFTSLTFTGPAKPQAATTPVLVPKRKLQSQPEAQPSALDGRETQVLEHLRKPTTSRPRSEKKLVSYLVAYLGRGMTEVEALGLIKYLSQAGHLAIDEKGQVTYHVDEYLKTEPHRLIVTQGRPEKTLSNLLPPLPLAV
jgi:hypothetical protein